MRLSDLQKQANELSRRNGFWSDNPNLAEKLMLIVTEVAEACEELRTNAPYEYTDAATSKPEGLAAELADVVIRVADLAEHCGIDLEAAIKAKQLYNFTRPFRHGKQF